MATNEREMPPEIYAVRVQHESDSGFWDDDKSFGTPYLRKDRYADNLISETKALREQCDALEQEISAITPQPVENKPVVVTREQIREEFIIWNFNTQMNDLLYHLMDKYPHGIIITRKD